MTANDTEIKVLLIEDNHTDYLLTSKIFAVLPNKHRISLEWCQSYEEGLALLMQDEHDIYLVDYTLGAKNGLDLIEESHSKNPEIGPFILLTDFDAERLLERSVQLGIYDHILKSELSPSIIDRTLTYAIQRFQTEQALKSEKEFNSFILSEVPYLIVSVDKHGLISSANPAVTDLIRRDEADLLGKPWKDLLHEDDRDNIKYKINDSGDVAFETHLNLPDDEERIINWNILNKGSGREELDTTAFILSGKDITDQLKIEETERRRQKMEALGQLAGGVAHEINNLLQPILMSSQMAAAKITEGPQKKDKEYLLKNMERIERNTKNAAKIVDDILLFSRGDQKDLERVPLQEAVLEAVMFVNEMMPSTINVNIDLEKLNPSRIANINKHELIQIITNMFINASHAMFEKGDITIKADSIFLPPKEAHFLKLQRGDYAEISISDTGKGISEEDLAHIFNPFFTTKEVGEGTGLGLSIVYNIIERWSGSIRVESEVGVGTTFFIYIPIVEA